MMPRGNILRVCRVYAKWSQLVGWHMPQWECCIKQYTASYFPSKETTKFYQISIIMGITSPEGQISSNCFPSQKGGGQVLLLQNYPHPLSLRGRDPYYFPTPLNTLQRRKHSSMHTACFPTVFHQISASITWPPVGHVFAPDVTSRGIGAGRRFLYTEVMCPGEQEATLVASW